MYANQRMYGGMYTVGYIYVHVRYSYYVAFVKLFSLDSKKPVVLVMVIYGWMYVYDGCMDVYVRVDVCMYGWMFLCM